MNEIQKLINITQEITLEQCFSQVAKVFRQIYNLSIDDLCILWETMLHFEKGKNLSEFPQWLHLKTVVKNSTISAFRQQLSSGSYLFRVSQKEMDEQKIRRVFGEWIRPNDLIGERIGALDEEYTSLQQRS